MSFLKNLFNKQTDKNQLIGNWFSDLKDEKTKISIGEVEIIFVEDGKMIYKIKEGDTIQIINMIYSVDGNILITDQPSYPKEERTEFVLIDEKTLILKFQGEESKFYKG